MIQLQVNIEAEAVQRGIADVMACLQDRTELHENMAQAVESEVTAHLLVLNSRSPHSSFYGRAARSTQVEADENGALVSVTHIGLPLRYYGGHVVPVTPGVKNLSLPTDNVPMQGERRQGPREAGILAFIPARSGNAGTTGYFVEGVEQLITNGKNKGKQRIVRKEGGKMMFVLRKWTDHTADESVLPTIAKMQEAAREAGLAVLEARGNGGPA